MRHGIGSVLVLLFISGASLMAAGVCCSPVVSGEVSPDVLGSGIGRFNSLLCHDLDGDGRDEIIFGSYEGVVVSAEYNGGDYFVDWQSPRFGTRCWGLAVGQFDDDESVELIVGDGDGQVRSIDGKTKKIEWESEKLVRDAHGLLLHDLDGDGKNELLVGTGFKTDQGWGQIYMFRQGQREHFDALPPFDSRIREMDVADVDGDGDEELVVCCGSALGDVAGEGYVRIFGLHDRELEWKSPDLGGCMEGLRIVDLDGGGGLDMIFTNGYRYREGYMFIYRFEDGDYRQLWKSPNIGPKAYGLDVGDVDDDGSLEIAVGNLAGHVMVFDGVSRQEEWRSENLGRDILGIALGDPDGDGSTEIIAAQGGYIGKGDYTSGYTAPHVYVIDGKSKEIEAVLGEVDQVLSWLKAGLLLAAVVMVAQLVVLSRYYVIWRRGVDKEKRRGGVQ